MLIRQAAIDDVEALAALHLDVWEEAYADLVPPAVLATRRATPGARVELWRAILSQPTGTVLVAEDSGRLTGFVSTGPGRDLAEHRLPALELMALYVRAEVYGTGVGHRLFTASVGASPAYLWVLGGNERAVAFYQRQGFRLDGATRSDEVGTELRMVRD